MSFIDVFIPLVAGILLITSPQLFTKSQGETFDRTKKKLRIAGIVLVCVAALYLIMNVLNLIMNVLRR